MIVWRISRFATLDGLGGLYASARWHTRGRRIVYCAPNPATALLELLVHSEVTDPQALVGYTFLKIEVPDDVSRERADTAALPGGWLARPAISRGLGDRWLGTGRALLLEVPCVIVPETGNVLVNPQHPDFNRVRIVDVLPYTLDQRLTR